MISTTNHDIHKTYLMGKVKESLKTRKLENLGMPNTKALVPIGYTALVSGLL